MVRMKKVLPATVRLGRGVAAAAVSSFILHDLGFVLDTVLAMPRYFVSEGEHADRAGTPAPWPPSRQVLNYTPEAVLDEAVVHDQQHFFEDDGNSQGSAVEAASTRQLLLPVHSTRTRSLALRRGMAAGLASNCVSPSCFSTRSGEWSTSENDRSRSPEQFCSYSEQDDRRAAAGSFVLRAERRRRDGGASAPSRLSATLTFPPQQHLPHFYKQTSQSAPNMLSLDHAQLGAELNQYAAARQISSSSSSGAARQISSSSSSGSVLTWGGGWGQTEPSKSAPPLGLGSPPGAKFACAAGLGAGVAAVQDAEWSDSVLGCWSPARIQSESDSPALPPGMSQGLPDALAGASTRGGGGLLSRASLQRGPRAVAGSGGPLLPATAPTAPTPQNPGGALEQDQKPQDDSQLPQVPETPEQRPMASPSASPEQRPMASPAGSGIATPGASTREPSPAHTTSHSGDVSTAAEDEADDDDDDDDDDDVAGVERDEAAGVAVTPRGRRGLLLPAAFPVDLDAHPPRPVSPEPTRRSSGTYPYNKDGELCSHALETLNSPESCTNTKGGDHRDGPQCDVNALNHSKPSKKKQKATGAARHQEHALKTSLGVVAVAHDGHGAPQESNASASGSGSGSAAARKEVNEFTVTSPNVLLLKERMNKLRRDLASNRVANFEKDEDEAMGAGRSYRLTLGGKPPDIWWTPSVRMLTESEVADLLRPDYMEVEGVVPTAVGGVSLLEQLYTTRCTSHGCDRKQVEDLLATVVGGHELLGLADDFADEGEHASGSWEHEQQLGHGRGEQPRDLTKVGQRHDLRRSRYSYPVEHEFDDHKNSKTSHGRPSPSGSPARGAGSGSEKPFLAGGPELAERVRGILDGILDLWRSEGARDEDPGRRNWLSSEFKQYHKILVRDIRGLAVMKQIAAPLGHVLAVEKEAQRNAGVAGGGRSPHSRPHYTRAMADADPAAAGALVRLLQKALERIAEFYREAMAQSEFRYELEAPFSPARFSETSLLRAFFPDALIFAYQKLYDAVISLEFALRGPSGTSISTRPSLLLQHLPGRNDLTFVRMPTLKTQSTGRGLHIALPDRTQESETPRLSPGLPAMLGAPEVMQRRGAGSELDTWSRTTAGGPMLQYSTYAHALGGSAPSDSPEGADWDCLSRVSTGLLPVLPPSPPIPTCPRRRIPGLPDFHAEDGGGPEVLRGGRPASAQALRTTRSGGDMAMASDAPPPLALWRWSKNGVGEASEEGWKLTYNPGGDSFPPAEQARPAGFAIGIPTRDDP